MEKETWIVVIKIFAISRKSHFLASTLDFTSFFTMAFFRATHFFYSMAILLTLTYQLQHYNSFVLEQCTGNHNVVML